MKTECPKCHKTAMITVICGSEIDLTAISNVLHDRVIDMDEGTIETTLRAMAEKPEERRGIETEAMVMVLRNFEMPDVPDPLELMQKDKNPRFKFQNVRKICK